MTDKKDPRMSLGAHRAGIVALVGRPNVGKSSLLNALSGESLSIVTPKPETTRERVMAVVHRPSAELVIVDTPGIHRAQRKLGEFMNREARAAAADADLVLMVADASEGKAGPGRESLVIETLATISTPVALVLNKIDRVRYKPDLLPLLQGYENLRVFTDLVPISADASGNSSRSVRGADGISELLELMVSRMPEGPALYPPDTLTDRPERFFASEKIREAVILESAAELPYATAVEIERFEDSLSVPRISATIHVERAGQKKILVGTGGERIKAIGTRARGAIERMLGRRVFLELWVKVTPDWTRSPEALARFGYAVPKKKSQ